MNKVAERAGWMVGAVAVGLASAISQVAHLPDVLSGPNVQVALGSQPDPHLITAWADRLLLQSCGLDGGCVHHWNATVFGLLMIVAGLVAVWTTRESARAIALLIAGTVGFSVLAGPLVVDPLGMAMTVSVALVVLAAIDATGLVAFPVVARCLLAIAIVAQDPLLAPAALAYGGLCAARSARGIARYAYAPLLCAVLAAMSRLPAILHVRFDLLSGPATIVVAGVALFVVGPLLIVLAKHRAFAAVGARAPVLGAGAILAASAVVGGAFAANGDPAPYWLAGESAIAIALFAPVSTGSLAPERLRNLLLLFIIGFGLQFWGLAAQHGSNTSVLIANQSAGLKGIFDRSEATRCVVSDAIGRRYLLADGAFALASGGNSETRFVDSAQNCFALPDSTRVATIDGLYVTNYGATLPLWRDARDTTGTQLAIVGGTISPNTPENTPSGHGAFGNGVATPLGVVGDFTVLSSFAYTPPCVPVRRHGHLTFEVTSVPGSPRLVFAIRDTGSVHALYRGVTPASSSDAPYFWHHISIELPGSKCSALTFSVLQPADGASRYWMTFAGAMVR